MIATQARSRADLLPLLRDLNELKRMRPAPPGRSLAELGFLRAWAAIAAGCDPGAVARAELDRALVDSRLAGTDEALLTSGGLTTDEATAVCADARTAALRRSGSWATALDDLLGERAPAVPPVGQVPVFADLLARQPRAPATRADLPRLSVEPPENHAEHCYLVAITGVVMAGIEPAHAASSFARSGTRSAHIGHTFVAGLAHHLHNAWLPDGGFAGEEALGDHLTTVVSRFRTDALAQLPASVATMVDQAGRRTTDETTAEGQAFHAADVIDRVLQTHHHADVAAFTVRRAMDEFGLVHEGPLQRYHHQVLAEVGL